MTVTMRTDHAGDGVAIGAEAVVFCGAGRPLERIGVPTVVLRPGEALVAIELVTLCAGDARLLRGDDAVHGPVVPGHEQVGSVVAVAPQRPPRDADGRPLEVGARIVWAEGVGCGRCVACRARTAERCRRLRRYGHGRVERGWELSGGCATHLQLLARTPVLRVPDDVPAAVAAAAAHGAYTTQDLVAGVARRAREVDQVFALADAQLAVDALLGDPGMRVGVRP